MVMAKTIRIMNGRAKLSSPTEKYHSWRIIWFDPITGKRRMTSGGASRDEAENKAAELLGDYLPESKRKKSVAPTLQEVFDSWVDANRYRWGFRTVDTYEYLAKRFLTVAGDKPITAVSPATLRKIDVSDLSRGQQLRVRTLIRGTFKHGETWLHQDIEDYANAIRVSGTKASSPNAEVNRGDIPSAKLVASFITTAYSTMQLTPLDDSNTTRVDPMTGVKTHSVKEIGFAPGLGLTTPTDKAFTDGLPLEITTTMRRGMPKHYKHQEQRRKDETIELAGRFRQIGLAIALGAGGGLRIGEILALRVKHFLTKEQIFKTFVMNVPRQERAYRGQLDVIEQASVAHRGKIWLSLPKGGRERTVHLPAFLPNWNGYGINTQRKQIAAIEPRLADTNISLWNATNEETASLWKAGFTPLAWMLWNRLEELWDSPALINGGKSTYQRKIKDYQDLLLFPTRNKARKTPTSSRVTFENTWPHATRIIEGTGTYQAETQYELIVNPLYDHVASIYDEWPAHRRTRKTRRGWTHHGLRHFAASSRIAAGAPLTLVAKELGHKNAAFTLQRYGHVMGEGVNENGFEY